MKKIYLDYAAATPMGQEMLAAMKPYFSERFHNPSATYLAGRAARHELNDWRQRAANVIGARPVEVVFTSGATEANNLALKGIKQAFPAGEILVSAVEHESVLKPALALGAKLIPVTGEGIVDLARLEKMLSDRTVLVSVIYVNNELGTIQPLAEIAKILDKLSISRKASAEKLPLYFHSDAAQAGNLLDLHISRLSVDMMSVNGGKIYGPKGSGLLYVKAGTKTAPQMEGGGQESGLRSGTENLASIAGLVTALELAQKDHKDENARLAALRADFEKRLLSLASGATINGGKKRAPHIISLTIPGQDNETLMMKLDEASIMCAVGSACSASSDEPSHVLKAIGLSDEMARASLRFSLGCDTTAAQLDTVVKTLSKILKS